MFSICGRKGSDFVVVDTMDNEKDVYSADDLLGFCTKLGIDIKGVYPSIGLCCIWSKHSDFIVENLEKASPCAIAMAGLEFKTALYLGWDNDSEVFMFIDNSLKPFGFSPRFLAQNSDDISFKVSDLDIDELAKLIGWLHYHHRT